MGSSRCSVGVGCAEIKVVLSMVPKKPAEEFDLEAWRHNELSPPSWMASTRRRFSFSKASFGATRKGQIHAIGS
jgi:hypothetical protein